MSNRLLSVENSVLLVVDVQEKFIDVVHEGEKLVEKTGILVQAASELGVPVVVSEQYTKGLGFTAPEVKALLPENTVVLEKAAFGCLADEAIRQHLTGLDRKQVLVCGLEAHVCVSQTVLQLLAEGYEVHVAYDAVTSRHKKSIKIALAKLEQAGAVPCSVEMALFEWMRCSTHPSFKTIQALIK